MYQTKDSGVRSEYTTGMVRDTQEGKARFDLLFPLGVPYSEQMLTRFADLMARGADKYDERNWEKARTQEEVDRYHSSAMRHLIQWIEGETDEDHAAAVMFNILAGETTKHRMVGPSLAGIVPREGELVDYGTAHFNFTVCRCELPKYDVPGNDPDYDDSQHNPEDLAPLGNSDSEGPEGERDQRARARIAVGALKTQ